MIQGRREGLVMMENTDNKQVLIKLTIGEAQQILAIDLDEDAQQALVFVTEKLTKKVAKSLQSS
jgi:hypothetical protein